LRSRYSETKVKNYEIAKNGILVEYGNKEAFKEAIELLSFQKSLYTEIKKNIEKNKYLFSKEYILKKWKDILETL